MRDRMAVSAHIPEKSKKMLWILSIDGVFEILFKIYLH